MIKDLTIRAYAPGDRTALSDIWWRATLMAHAFLGEVLLSQQRKMVEEVYLPKAETFVACYGALPVGFIGLLDTMIGGLFVDPDHGRHGVGRALVAYGLTLKPALELEVYAVNRAASAFYAAIGGVEIGRRPIDDNGLPFELIRMRFVR